MADRPSREATVPEGISGTRTVSGTHVPHGNAAPMEAGKTVGRFTITRVLGQGGMGVVYAARDPELGRLLAVKVLHRSIDRSIDDADERAQALLLREARAMAQVSHRNLVTIYDVGYDDGRAFIAMELIPGQTLGKWRRAAQRPWRDILAHYIQAGEGLLAAHDEGLVHRDFKPSKLLLSDKGRVAVVDFGLARAVATDAVALAPAPTTAKGQPAAGPQEATTTYETPTADTDAATQHAEGANLTRTGAIVGTPAYMSPEQFRGEPTDARTDQFALCIALWEALFDERPFEGTSPVTLMFAVIEGKRREVPTDTRVPEAIINALEVGLDPDRARRFEDMRALLDSLAATTLLDVPVTASKRGWLAAGVSVAVVGAIVGALVMLAQREPPRPSPNGTITAASPTAGQAALDGYVNRKDFRSTATLWRAAEQDFVRAWAGWRATPARALARRAERLGRRATPRPHPLDRGGVGGEHPRGRQPTGRGNGRVPPRAATGARSPGVVGRPGARVPRAAHRLAGPALCCRCAG